MGRELRKLKIVADPQADPMALEFQQYGLSPRSQHEPLPIPKVDLSIYGEAVPPRGKRRVVECAVIQFGESSHDEQAGGFGNVRGRLEGFVRFHQQWILRLVL